MGGYWAKAPVERDQMFMFSPTLDHMIGPAHPVRLFDELLAKCDWSAWEAHYHGKVGQPPIHPRVVASVVLYGLSHGMRSSRRLEYACLNSIDFIWLVQGRTLDHSTICGFRTQFSKELKGLFRQVCKIAMAAGLIQLGEVTLDGTRVKANNGRFQTATGKQLEDQLKALDEMLDQMMREADLADASDASSGESSQLPPELADLKERQARLQEAMEKVKAADAAKAKEGSDTPAQLPTTDPDSKVMPNKEGGFAPNYTPMASVDVHSGFVVQVDVRADVCEHAATLTMIDGITQDFGQTPERLLADGHYATGQNLVGLDARKVELFSPAKSQQPSEDNPARRDDPSQPVSPEQWDKLPRNAQTKRLDKSCFIYDEKNDLYYCPLGQPLNYEETKSDVRSGERVKFGVYRCQACASCPLAGECLQPSAKRGRQISRDQYTQQREALAAKMASDAGRAMYAKRLHPGEVIFAIIKRVMGVRQFLLRGLEKVKTEWLWVCTAFNLMKLQREIARLRAEFARLQVEGI